MNDFTRQAIVITGASGGIGTAIAARCAAMGYTLYLQGYKRIDSLTAFAQQYRAKGGIIKTLAANLADPVEQDFFVDSVLESIDQEKQVLHGWINAAGVDLMALSRRKASFDEKLSKILAIDVTSVTRMSRRVGVYLCDRQTEQGYSSVPLILFFGWDGVERGQEGETAQLYSLAKGAVLAFSRSLAQSLAPKVRVCSISPGWIKTTWAPLATARSVTRVEKESLAKRWGTADEVAAVAQFLLSDDASYLNGQNIVVNGGYNYRFEPS